jgi:hypothetical protein
MASLQAHGWIGERLLWQFDPSARSGFREGGLARSEIVLEVGRWWEGGIVKGKERSLYGVRGGSIQEVFLAKYI